MLKSQTAYLQASCDADKGEVLDALGDKPSDSHGGSHSGHSASSSTKSDPLRFQRKAGMPAHVPYLKRIPEGTTHKVSGTKDVWCFEALDRTRCSEVGSSCPCSLPLLLWWLNVPHSPHF